MGIAIWLVPPEKEGEKLKSIMRAPIDKCQLPEQSPSYPDFYPHITLASFPPELDIPLSAIEAAFSDFSIPIEVEFQSLETGSHFFRSVFIKIAQSSNLSLLHDQIHFQLGIKVETPEFPHLSLAYIDDNDALKGERKKFTQYLESACMVRHDGGKRIYLNCGGQSTEDGWISGFSAFEVWIMDCRGLVEEWNILRRQSIYSR